MSLCKCLKENIYIVDKSPDIYLLKVLGIRRGISFKVQSIHPFGGPIVIKVGNRSIAISKDVASEILVREAS